MGSWSQLETSPNRAAEMFMAHCRAFFFGRCLSIALGITFGHARPIDDASAVQGPPRNNRLQHQTEAVVETAIGNIWQVNAINRMFKVGGPDADGVDGHRDAGPMAKRPGYQRNGDHELENAR